MTLRIAIGSLLFIPSFLFAQAEPPPAQVEPRTGAVTVGVSPGPFHYTLSGPDVAIPANQHFLVSWDLSYTEYSGSNLVDWGSAISGRRVSFEGQPFGGEELVLDPFERHVYQGPSRLAAQRGLPGRFALIWEEIGNPGAIKVRLFAGDANPFEPKTPDIAPAGLAEKRHAVAMDPSGRFAAAWTRLHRSNVPRSKAQLFDLVGRPLLEPFLLPEGAASPALAMDGQGITVLAEVLSAASRPQVVVQRYDPEGNPVGGRTEVAAGTFPAVAANPEGRFAVTWVEPGGIGARVFDSSGRSVSPAVRVTTVDRFEDTLPDIAMDVHGNFVVVWVGAAAADAPRDIRGRLFNRDGVPQGGVFRVDPTSRPFRDAPAVAMNDAGAFLVVWAQPLEDDFSGIQSRLFAALRDDDRCVWRDGSFLCDTARDGDPSHFEALFGRSGDVPLLADFDGDGDDDLCVRRGGAFLCDTAGNGGAPELTLRFGSPVQTPLAGDLDGDGDDDPCVRRGRFFLCDTAHNSGAAEVRIPLGVRSDLPALGDVDGDGDDDPCVWRGSSGTFLCDASHDGSPDLTHAVDSQAGDQPLLGDVDGDGDADFCLARGEDLFCDLDRDGQLTQETLAAEPGDVLLLGNVDGL